MFICKICKVPKSLSEFHKNKTYGNGHASKCKSCAVEASRQWALANPEKIKATAKRWVVNNPDKIKQDSKNRRAGTIKRVVEWRKNNPEKLAESVAKRRAKNPELFRQWGAKWQRQNSEQVNAKTAKRRALKAKAIPKWANLEQISKIYCQAKIISNIVGVPFHVDHIVPIQSKIVCGLHCEFNLQLLTKNENSSKSNRHWPDMP